MEKHIIFLYPIHPVIQELKDILEKDGTYDINEVDNANEYRQLVGIIGQSVTITSDIKKIQSTIDTQAQLIKNGISKVIILGKLQGFNSEVHQLRVLGVQEILPETTPLKSLQFKLNLFLKSFEAAEEKKEKEKNKESDLAIIKSKKASGSLFDDEVIENLKKLKREAEKEAGKGDISNAFDFKGFVRKEITPFTVGPVTPEKRKSLYKPLVIKPNYDRRSVKASGERLEFDDVEEEKKEYGKVDELNHYKTKTAKKTSDLEFNQEDPIKKIGVDQLNNYSHKSIKSGPQIDFDKEDEKNKAAEENGNELKRKQSTPLRLERDEEGMLKGEEGKETKSERKKYNAFHVDDLGNKKLNTAAEVSQDNHKKGHNSLRLDNTNEKDKVDGENPADKLYQENKMTLDTEKDWGEQTIDYATFEDQENEKKYTRHNKQATPPKTEISDEEFSLTYPVYYWPPDGISTFIPLLLEVLQTRPFDQNKFVQFICFMFNKKLGGHLTYFIEREEGKNEVLGSSYLIGNKEWDYKTLYSEFDMTRMQNISVPTWSDSTFQGHSISFIFPFYYNKQRMGFAYAYFELSSIRNQQEALEAELLIVMARTVFLKEFGY